VVVNFAVVNYVKRSIFIRHRLVAGSNVNDAETAMAETNPSSARIDEDTLIVRPAMCHHVTHALQYRDINTSRRSARQGYSVNSTHR
jgi:hypothetical protein